MTIQLTGVGITVPPVVTVNPQNQTVTVGNNVTFSLTATGTRPLAYQWQRSIDGGVNWSNLSNDATYSGATTPTLTIAGTTMAMSGYQFRAVVSNAVNPSATSNSAALTVALPQTSPVIESYPVNQAVLAGQSTSFAVAANGNPTPAYQWQSSVDGGLTWNGISNNSIYAGATTRTLTVNNVTPAMNGYLFRAVASNGVSPDAISPTATLTVNASTVVTVIGMTAANKVYDGTTTAVISTSGASLTGVLAADVGNVNLVIGGAVGTFADKNVATGKTVTVSGLTLSGSAAGNYNLAQPTATANITARSLTVAGVTVASKVYDGTTVATINTGGATLNGVLAIDSGNVGLVPYFATGTFADKNVGSSKAVTINGLGLSGNAAGNYSLTQPTATASINALALTVAGIAAANKVYDGATAATLDTSGATLVGVLPADAGNVSLATSGATGAFADPSVGVGKPVTITGLALSGTAAGNYTLIQPTTTASITEVGNLTVTGITAANKVYDGTTVAVLSTSGAALSGVAPADAGKVSLVTVGASGAFTDKNVGTGKTVDVTGLSLSGTAAGNYTLTQPTTTASITPRSLTMTGITAADKVYDGTTTATANGTPSLTGAVSGDAVAVSGTATAAFADKNVGTGKPVAISGLILIGSAAGNYALTQPTTTANIAPRGLTVTGITAANKVYDGTTTATLNTSAATLAGVLTADNANVNLVTSGASGMFSDANVGTGKAVTISGLTVAGAMAGNYALTQPSTTAAISPVGSVTVAGITAANKVYDGTTAATINLSGATLSGVSQGDAGKVTLVTTGATGSFGDKNVGTGKTVTINGLTLSGSAAANYTIKQPTVTADLTPLGLTVTGITAASKVYDGTTTAVINTSGARLNGVLTGDTANVTLVANSGSGAFTDANAGTGKTVVIAGLVLTGSAARNYTLTQPTTTADIAPPPTSFVTRQLPAGYMPGVPLPVTLQASPASTVASYTVSDQPPSGWTVSSISNSGLYDNVNQKVKFGPFFDNSPRTLTYQVTPPAGESGAKTFIGNASADGVSSPITGNLIIALAQTHPADLNADFRIVDSEVTGYGAAWKRGSVWSIGPNPILDDYVTRAGFLWQKGEYYKYDQTAGAPPLCWVNVVPRSGPSLASYRGRRFALAGTAASTAVSTLPATCQPGVAFQVTIQTLPTSGSFAQTISDQPPAGWAVSAISSGGSFDAVNAKVKWGPFFDDQGRALSYTVTPPATASGTATFMGNYSVDGINITVTGQRQTTVTAAQSDSDGDGFTDAQEAIAGTDPANPADYLHITNVARSGNDVLVSFTGVIGEVYTVESKDTLTDAAWVARVVFTNTVAGIVTTSDGGAARSASRFYHVVTGPNREVISEPAGFTSLPLVAGANPLSVPLPGIAAARGLVTAVSGNTVTLNGNPGWAANALAPANGFSQYVLVVLSDAAATAGSMGIQGDWWTISGNTANSVTVNAGSDNLPAVLAVGSAVAVRKLQSMKDLFGTGSTVILNKDSTGAAASGDGSRADVIRFLSGTSFSQPIFYHDGSRLPAGYYIGGSGPFDGSTITVLPGQAFLFFRMAGSAPTTFTVSGAVNTTRVTAYLQPGPNAVGIEFPVAASVAASNLKESGWNQDSTGAAATGDFTNADLFRHIAGTSFDSPVFYHNGSKLAAGWYQGASPSNNFTFQPGQGYIFFMKGPNPARWRQAVPYSP